MSNSFDEWLKNRLKCEWEDYEDNLSDNDMKAAYAAGLERAAVIASKALQSKFNDYFWKTLTGKDKASTLDAKSVVMGISNAIWEEIK
jgi:hypothetical protein